MNPDMNKRNDDIDWQFRNIFKKDPKWKSSKGSPKAILYGDITSDEYSMEFPNMGKCFIFNHKTFDKLPERKGSDEDASRLYCQFRKFGFKVETFDDYKVGQISEKLKEVAQEDHTENSCFVCCILTHGQNGILCAKDGIYPVNSLYEFFKGSACPTLVPKPKIFFIQACQGFDMDGGVPVKVVKKESMDSPLKIPTYADFLIVLSTFPGFVAFKNESTGSYFMQFLCDVLEEYAKDKHLIDMLTIVNRRFALCFESSNCKDASKDKKKQIPYITSTLTKNVKFPQKAIS